MGEQGVERDKGCVQDGTDLILSSCRVTRIPSGCFSGNDALICSKLASSSHN